MAAAPAHARRDGAHRSAEHRASRIDQRIALGSALPHHRARGAVGVPSAQADGDVNRDHVSIAQRLRSGKRMHEAVVHGNHAGSRVGGAVIAAEAARSALGARGGNDALDDGIEALRRRARDRGTQRRIDG
jgi:hypothetical protein